MRERKHIIFRCPTEDYSVKLIFDQQMDPWRRRPIMQHVQHCSYRNDNLCKIEINPTEGETQCPAAQLAKKAQLR